MKYSVATLSAILAVVSAQSIADLTAQIPSCAQTCLATAIPAAGCALTDNACQCGTAKDAITKAATPCVVSGCSSDDALKTQSLTTQICALVASSGSGSSSAASSATSAASSASSAGSSSATSATSAASESASSASSAGASATSKAASASSAASSVASSASKAASSAASSAASVASSATASSASATATTNAGNRKEAVAGVVGAAFLAALAL